MRHFPRLTLAPRLLTSGVVAGAPRCALVGGTGPPQLLTTTGSNAFVGAIPLALVAARADPDQATAPRAVEEAMAFDDHRGPSNERGWTRATNLAMMSTG